MSSRRHGCALCSRLAPAARDHVELPDCDDILIGAVKRVPRNERRGDRQASRSVPGSGSRARIELPVVLIVDDSEDNRELFAMCLERLGYQIELAVDGLDALDRARKTLPTVILMDLAMPNMDGFDATRHIRMDPELSSVHIIAITAFSDAVSTQRALAAGCNAILAKPCPPEILAACVESAVRAPTPTTRARDAG